MFYGILEAVVTGALDGRWIIQTFYPWKSLHSPFLLLGENVFWEKGEDLENNTLDEVTA